MPCLWSLSSPFNSSNLVAWSDCDSQHSIICKIEKGEEHGEYIPEKFQCRPLKSYHGVREQSIHGCLNKYVGNLNYNLKQTAYCAI